MYCFSAKHTSNLIQTLGITTVGSCVVWTAAQTKQTKAKSMSHKISSSSLDPLNWSRDQKGEEGKEEVSLCRDFLIEGRCISTFFETF